MAKWDYVKVSGFALLLGAIFFWRAYTESSTGYLKERLNEELSVCYSGVVVRKYHDSKNHNTPILVFTDSAKVSISDEYWKKINSGDSLLKIKGSAYIFRYRNGRLKKFHYTGYMEKKLRDATLK
jgi:hypothetical protein